MGGDGLLGVGASVLGLGGGSSGGLFDKIKESQQKEKDKLPPPPPPPVVPEAITPASRLDPSAEQLAANKSSTRRNAKIGRQIVDRSLTQLNEGFGLSSSGASTGGRITLG